MTGPNYRAERHYAQAEDSELVAWAKDDSVAFGELYTRYVQKIYNYVYYRTGNHQDAEDLTSRVFFRALGHIENYTDRGVPFSAWLYRIAHNLVANWHRDRGRQKVVPLEEHIPSGHHSNAPEAMTESIEEQEQLLHTIRQLPPERQQLLILKFVERLSNAEIGAIMDRTEGAIKSLYHRTLLSLRGKLEKSDLISEETAPASPRRKRRRRDATSEAEADEALDSDAQAPTSSSEIDLLAAALAEQAKNASASDD